MKEKILIVEDDLALSAGLCFELQADQYIVMAAYNCRQAVQVMESDRFDLVILDVNLPDGSGMELCRTIRESYKTPVVFLTACDMEQDILDGFDLGAEDYITKPFNIQILRRKLEVVLRRNKQEPVKKGDGFSDGYLSIDFEALAAAKNGEQLVITPNEYKILKLLIANAGNVVTRQLLLEKLWDSAENYIDEHTLTVNMTRLRNKIEDADHKYIKTIYGMGYVFTGENQ